MSDILTINANIDILELSCQNYRGNFNEVNLNPIKGRSARRKEAPTGHRRDHKSCQHSMPSCGLARTQGCADDRQISPRGGYNLADRAAVVSQTWNCAHLARL